MNKFRLEKKYIIMFEIVLGIITLSVVINLTSVIQIEKYQLNKNEKLISNYPKNESSSTILVVYFSRSGNTELMALEIAKIKNAHVLRIDADEYKIGFLGWLNAMKDARDHIASISPSTIDLSSYRTIYIGSPIWLYSPAPPIWEFVRNNDFTSKDVILFNSLNSKFEQRFIEDFAKLVSERKGNFLKHIFIIRGRMTWQMETEDFLKEVKTKLEK
ncbi:flavodoxin family protein [Leptospira ilyithenensis]|nr:flavodoxin [Leptospira ilyithenensis]